MILKRENNFSDRVNDPVSMGKKVPMLTPMDLGSFWSSLDFHLCKIVKKIDKALGGC